MEIKKTHTTLSLRTKEAKAISEFYQGIYNLDKDNSDNTYTLDELMERISEMWTEKISSTTVSTSLGDFIISISD